MLIEKQNLHDLIQQARQNKSLIHFIHNYEEGKERQANSQLLEHLNRETFHNTKGVYFNELKNVNYFFRDGVFRYNCVGNIG